MLLLLLLRYLPLRPRWRSLVPLLWRLLARVRGLAVLLLLLLLLWSLPLHELLRRGVVAVGQVSLHLLRLVHRLPVLLGLRAHLGHYRRLAAVFSPRRGWYARQSKGRRCNHPQQIESQRPSR